MILEHVRKGYLPAHPEIWSIPRIEIELSSVKPISWASMTRRSTFFYACSIPTSEMSIPVTVLASHPAM